MRHSIPKLLELLMVGALGMTALSCDGKAQSETETHFLTACSTSCPSGLSCVCGACTEACSSSSACSRFPGGAACAPAPAGCGADVATACDVVCSNQSECRGLGDAFACVAGRCRTGGAPDAGSGGSSGTGGGSTGGRAGGSGGSGGAGGAGGTAGNGGTSGSGGAGSGGGSGGACGTLGAPCCDPFPGDGPNYCLGGLTCGGEGCVDCQCVRGAFIPVCGVDGQTYDSACGRACVPVPIACDHACPCNACPAEPPVAGTGCTAGSCYYEECGSYGRLSAECAGGSWTVGTAPCAPVECRPTSCGDGQACVTHAGGAIISECAANSCAGAVQCDCIQGCSPGCTVTANVAAGVSVYCNTCPGGGCP